MDSDIWKYFVKKYIDCEWRVTPGHWPDFKSKEEVDQWFERMKEILTVVINEE